MFERLVKLYIAYLYAKLEAVDKSDLLKIIIKKEMDTFDFSSKEHVAELISAMNDHFGEERVQEFLESEDDDKHEDISSDIEFVTPDDFKDLRREITKAPIHADGIKLAHSLSKHLERHLLLDEIPEIAYDEEKIILDWTKGKDGVSVIIDDSEMVLIVDKDGEVKEFINIIVDIDQDAVFESVVTEVSRVTCGGIQ